MNVSNKVERDYFNWLYDQVGGREGLCNQYQLLMSELHAIDFYWTIINDSNRAEDGKNLRTRFSFETGEVDDTIIYQPCSVLEMMVALACRMEDDIMYDMNYGNRTDCWFYEMISNMNLENCTDEEFTYSQRDYVRHVITKMMDRNYEKNGFGGLFPLKRPVRDQTKVEIWLQMTAFLNENR